jgi:hypothetical protein
MVIDIRFITIYIPLDQQFIEMIHLIIGLSQSSLEILHLIERVSVMAELHPNVLHIIDEFHTFSFEFAILFKQ